MSGAERIEQLEMTAAHLARTVEDLSDELARQGREIDLLRRGMVELLDRIDALSAGGAPAANQKPPHW